jgi:hypothetical protein
LKNCDKWRRESEWPKPTIDRPHKRCSQSPIPKLPYGELMRLFFAYLLLRMAFDLITAPTRPIKQTEAQSKKH